MSKLLMVACRNKRQLGIDEPEAAVRRDVEAEGCDGSRHEVDLAEAVDELGLVRPPTLQSACPGGRLARCRLPLLSMTPRPVRAIPIGSTFAHQPGCAGREGSRRGRVLVERLFTEVLAIRPGFSSSMQQRAPCPSWLLQAATKTARARVERTSRAGRPPTLVGHACTIAHATGRCFDSDEPPRDVAVEVVLSTHTADGVDVVLPAIVWAKVLEVHREVADLGLIDRTVREPHVREDDPILRRERFYRRERGAWTLVVVLYESVPAIIVTAFTPERPPT